MVEKKTTLIGDEAYRQLFVEWNTYTGGRLQPDGTLPVRRMHRVTLVQNSGVRLLDLSPQTALNLLAWLEQERVVLEAEAKRNETSS
jgi:hypothetical protein